METIAHQPKPATTTEEESDEELQTEQLLPSDASPEEFYDAFTKRKDVRAILEALASS
jgi:hypothetical protein